MRTASSGFIRRLPGSALLFFVAAVMKITGATAERSGVLDFFLFQSARNLPDRSARVARFFSLDWPDRDGVPQRESVGPDAGAAAWQGLIGRGPRAVASLLLYQRHHRPASPFVAERVLDPRGLVSSRQRICASSFTRFSRSGFSLMRGERNAAGKVSSRS